MRLLDPGPDVHRQDRQIGRSDLVEVRARLRAADAQREAVNDLDMVQPRGFADMMGPAIGRAVAVIAQREGHVVSDEGLAVVPMDAVTQANVPAAAILAFRRDAFGQPGGGVGHIR